MTQHRLDASPETVHWGYFDAARKPLLTIENGDVVTISTVSGVPAQMPPQGFAVQAAESAGRHSCHADATATGPYLHRAGRRARRQTRHDA